jgi:hypothetical protein
MQCLLMTKTFGNILLIYTKIQTRASKEEAKIAGYRLLLLQHHHPRHSLRLLLSPQLLRRLCQGLQPTAPFRVTPVIVVAVRHLMHLLNKCQIFSIIVMLMHLINITQSEQHLKDTIPLRSNMGTTIVFSLNDDTVNEHISVIGELALNRIELYVNATTSRILSDSYSIILYRLL